MGAQCGRGISMGDRPAWGEFCPSGADRPNAQARGGFPSLVNATWGPAIHTHHPQDRTAAEVTGVSDPQLPADHRAECKHSLQYTQARLPGPDSSVLGDKEIHHPPDSVPPTKTGITRHCHLPWGPGPTTLAPAPLCSHRKGRSPLSRAMVT